MDCYVIHIYRRPGKAGEKLAGLVERIGNGERKAFMGEHELLSYLALEPTRRRPRSRWNIAVKRS